MTVFAEIGFSHVHLQISHADVCAGIVEINGALQIGARLFVLIQIGSDLKRDKIKAALFFRLDIAAGQHHFDALQLHRQILAENCGVKDHSAQSLLFFGRDRQWCHREHPRLKLVKICVRRFECFIKRLIGCNKFFGIGRFRRFLLFFGFLGPLRMSRIGEARHSQYRGAAGKCECERELPGKAGRTTVGRRQSGHSILQL